MKAKKIIIIGGGIAGMSAGIYARQSGFDVEILEMHSIPGGSCTSWKRNGYLFEGGMHWLVGSSKAATLNKLWLETGALTENTKIHNKDPFLTYLYEGKNICLYRNPEKLRKHLLSISPQDEAAINELIKDILKFQKMNMPIFDIKGVKAKYKTAPPLSMLFYMMGAMTTMKRLSSMSLSEYTAKFRHEGIRALLNCAVGSTEFSATSLIFTLAGLSVGDSGYPEGGSLKMAQNMADKFKQLGGNIRYNVLVDEVVYENGKVTGVMADDFLPADAVIVTQDARSAMDKLFNPPLKEQWLNELKTELQPVTCTFISMGIKADLSDMPENIILPLKRPFEWNGEQHSSIGINNYANFDGYAPQGCTAITSVIMGDSYNFWSAARKDSSYAQKKQELANIIADRLSEILPQIKDKIEVVDIATPLTYERYCGTFHGSWMSILPANCKRQQYPQCAESVKGLYFAGHRLMLPGGMPIAVSTGRQAAQYACKDFNLVFQGEM